MLYHIKGYEIRFYDNLKDTETVAKISEKRSIEKDNTLSDDDLQKLFNPDVSKKLRFHYGRFIFSGVSRIILWSEHEDDIIFNNLVEWGYSQTQAGPLFTQ